MHRNELRRWISEELFDTVPIRIAVVDRDYRIVAANRGFKDSYGEAFGKLCYSVYKGSKNPCPNCGAAKAFETGRVVQTEEAGIDREGEQAFYIIQAVPLVLEGGEVPYVIEMSTDITRIKKLEKQKLEAERLAAVGQTVAGLAHGIKNIIMGLEGGMYVVNSGIKRNDPERLLNGWKMLEQEITRISAFAKEFLDFSRGRMPSVKLADPASVVEQVAELFRDRATRSGIELQTSVQPDIDLAPIDEQGLHASLTNLVSNAIDACEMSEKPKNHVRIAVGEEDGVIVYEVSDDGCGMDYDIRRRVFSNFFSTKAAGRGTGLGLLTTRKIVQQHGGSVSFDSEEGRGSAFRIELFRDRLPELSSGSEGEGEIDQERKEGSGSSHDGPGG